MKPHFSLLAALLLSFTAPAPGQNPAPAAAPAAAPQTEMQKWLADLDAQWQAAFKRDVSDAYTAENDKLRGQYVAALEAGLTKASGAGDLNAAIVWRNEQKRFTEASGIPAQDDAADAPAVKQLRAAWRSQLPRIETDRATRAKALLAKYDQVLAQAQAQLTKGNRIDDAILVKAKRDEVGAAWLAGIPVAPPVIATGLPKPSSVIPNPGIPKTEPIRSGSSAATPAAATKDKPFVNTLGQEFVPVPGTQVLFCRWLTRVKDYTRYAKANAKTVDSGWKTQEHGGIPVGREPDHPVMGMSWDHAQDFCKWLTKKETAEGKLPKGMKYRLPTDEEWSIAVGLPPEAGETPAEKHGKDQANFPWGTDWPPKGKVGNYGDETYHAKSAPKDDKKPWIEGYTDGFVTTSPVGSFPANAFGLYDMGGNAWQWCEDWINKEQTGRVLRGASWTNHGRVSLLSSFRINNRSNFGGNEYGFRCVLDGSVR